MSTLALSSEPTDKLPASDTETEISRPVDQPVPKPRNQMEGDADRIKSAIARLTSSSIDGLEGLATELQQLQDFLRCEVERVQGEIESALAGINIIMETIAPWKTTSVPMATAPGPRGVRGGPAANIEVGQSRR